MGATNQRCSGIGIVMISSKCITTEKSLRLDFSTTNNEVGYKAFIVGLDFVKKLRWEFDKVSCDSRLAVRQVRGEFETKDQRMQWYLCRVKQLQANFKTFTINQVSRSKNTYTDSLATLATSDLMTSSYGSRAPIAISSVCVEPSWMDPMVLFIKNGILPKDKLEVKKKLEPLSNILDQDLKKFICRNIVTRFGVPHTFILDNGL